MGTERIRRDQRLLNGNEERSIKVRAVGPGLYVLLFCVFCAVLSWSPKLGLSSLFAIFFL